MASIEIQVTDRGFQKGTFIDAYGAGCSIQVSSVSNSESLVWLGPDANRMHLSQSQVRALLPLLQHFAEHGRLADQSESGEPEQRSRLDVDRDLRDYFAGQALTGFLANPNYYGCAKETAIDAYNTADAMLAFRENSD